MKNDWIVQEENIVGQAKIRGTTAERQQAARDKAFDDAEVLIFLSEKDNGIRCSILPRDEKPNAQSLAVILASWLDSNLPAVMKAAVQAKLASEQPTKIAAPAARSVTAPDGGLAKEAPALLGPDGKRLQ